MTHAFDELTDEQAFALEALAHGEDDLVPDALRAELEGRDDFRALLEHAKALSIDVGLAFRQTAPPEPDVEAMVASVLPGLAGGAPVLSQTLTVHRPEGEIAGPLSDLAADFPELSIGCYPFQKDGSFGANIVVRGQNGGQINQAMTRLARDLAE